MSVLNGRGRCRLLPAALGVAALMLGAAAAPVVATTPRPLRVVDLGTLGGSCCSEVYRINGRGDVVGTSNIADMGATHAFLWPNGRMTDLGTLGGLNSRALDVNSHGDVAGVGDNAGGAVRAFLWTRGRMIDFGTLGGDWSYANAINDRGECCQVRRDRQRSAACIPVAARDDGRPRHAEPPLRRRGRHQQPRPGGRYSAY